MKKVKSILIDDSHELFSKEKMYYKEYASDFRLIRFYARQVLQHAPQTSNESGLLEQQVAEIIKNAIRHGNKDNKNLKISIWYYFDSAVSRLIVSDQGEGFRELEEWNEFYRKKEECYLRGDILGLADYVSFRTAESAADDGGNALCAALEYWNMGIVFNSKRNSVALGRRMKKENAFYVLNEVS